MACLDSKITKLKKLKFCYFSKGVSPWFWSKLFSTFLFLAKSTSKMCFMIIIPERKKMFLDCKIRKLKKGLVHGFGKKI